MNMHVSGWVLLFAVASFLLIGACSGLSLSAPVRARGRTAMKIVSDFADKMDHNNNNGNNDVDVSLPVAPVAIAPKPHLAPGKLCQTVGYNFSCCDRLDFNLTIPFEGKVHFDDTVCASLVLNPNSMNATVTLSVNGVVLFQDTYSVYDLADFGVSICLDWTNVNWNPNTQQLSGCADIAAKVATITVFDLRLGCFVIHV